MHPVGARTDTLEHVDADINGGEPQPLAEDENTRKHQELKILDIYVNEVALRTAHEDRVAILQSNISSVGTGYRKLT